MTSSPESDAALWQRAQTGDPTGYAAIFDRHRDRVFRHGFHLSANRHDAEDVLAMAFLELWRRRSQVNLVDDSVLPWLLATATNCWRNIARGRRRYDRVLAELEQKAPRPVESPEDDYADRIDAARDIEEIRHRLSSLSARDAALLSLTALEGLVVVEAAAAIGMSPGAARVRLHRIRARLRVIPASAESAEVNR